MIKKIYLINDNTIKKLIKRHDISGDDMIIFDSNDDGIILRKARPIEDYFNTLPPLERNYKKRYFSSTSEKVRE